MTIEELMAFAAEVASAIEPGDLDDGQSRGDYVEGVVEGQLDILVDDVELTREAADALLSAYFTITRVSLVIDPADVELMRRFLVTVGDTAEAASWDARAIVAGFAELAVDNAIDNARDVDSEGLLGTGE